jgi:allophanate hydrolase
MPSFDRLRLAELVADVQAGRHLAVEVAATAIERAGAYDLVQPGVWITRPPPAAILDRAREVDERIARGERLPLAGAPFAVKDNLDVAGLPTTAGCPAFAYTPTETAPVVRRLMDAGALLIGKSNLDQFATGLVGTRTPYGACGSVYNRAYISGGSSSGSAVAVAAGLAAFALGTDTAGSGRVPAALNHLIGLKPTRGRWSTRGLVPACRTLDCVTALASSADDAKMVDGIVAGFDAEDPFSRQAPDPSPRLGKSFRVAVPKSGQINWLSDPQSAALFDAACRTIERIGGRMVDVDLAPLSQASAMLYEGPWLSERTASVERLLRAEPAAIDPTVRGILERGWAISAVEAFKAEYLRKALERAAEAIWHAADVLMLPTVATTYRIREVLAEPLALNASLGLYTNFVNLLDMAAVAVPAGFRDNQTVFGVSFIGPAWSDHRLLELARRYEEAAGLQDIPPIDLAGVRTGVKLAVVGAHLAAMPLHWQLTSRDARLVRRCRTAPVYKLYAIAGSIPPKPALVHVGEGGSQIEVEVYELDIEAFGDFVQEVPAPLAIGTLTLEDGADVKGFVAEPRALAGAEDITALGSWRAYVARQAGQVSTSGA